MHLKNRMLVHKRSNEEAMLRKQISSAEASKMELEKVSSSEDLNVISFSNTNDSINLQTSNTSKTDIALFDESNDNNKLDNVLNSGVNSKKCSPRKKNSRNNSKNNSKKSTPRMRTISAPESVDPISEHTGLTAEEEAHLQEHAPLLLQAHQKKVFSKEEMEKMGGVQLNSDEDISWVQIGDSFHMMKVPKRNRPKSDDKPILGIMYQSDTEVVHYK